MSIIVIAGGSGTRMQPLVTHKTIFPFLGIPIIEHTLNNLSVFNQVEIIIVTHPDAKDLIQGIADKFHAKVVIQQKSLGMADAVITAKSMVDPNFPLMIIDAVTIQELSVYSTFREHIDKYPELILLGGRKVTSYKPGGYFRLNDKNQVVEIVEKPGATNMPSSYLKLVLDYFPKAGDLLEYLTATTSKNDDVYEVALSKLIKLSSPKMVEVFGDHASLKYAYRVLDVAELFLKHYLKPGIDSTASIAPSATVDPAVQIGANVKIFENAVIKGNTFIGDNCVIGNGVLVRDSCIENDCEIGFNSEIARSYVGPNTHCHTSYVGDSIIEGTSNLAAGTITANLRFDEKSVKVKLPCGIIDTGRRKFGSIMAKGVKTGIHTSLMPGSVIDPGSIIYQGGVKCPKK